MAWCGEAGRARSGLAANGVARQGRQMSAILCNLDLSKLWTKTIGHNGERMITNIVLLFRDKEGGGYKAKANIEYLKESLDAPVIGRGIWEKWASEKIRDIPNAVVVNHSDGYTQGWLLWKKGHIPLISKLSESGVFDESFAQDVLIDWEDRAFAAQWPQFVRALPDHIRLSFNLLPKKERAQLAWDAYVYAKARQNVEPVTTFTKSVIPVNLLELSWLRYAKAKFPYPSGGARPRLERAASCATIR